MAFDATVLNVMIASPSDVVEERQVIREVIHEWNCLNAKEKQLVLLPVGWETHAAPELSGRPQGIVNRDVTDVCDLLIAVFWNRVGTPTGEADSGTVEEIRRHIDQGKIPPMLYFSDVATPPSEFDIQQRQKVDKFHDECKPRGVVWTYRSIDEFRQLLLRHLSQRIANWRESAASEGTMILDLPHDLPNTDDLPLMPQERLLSVDASELLLAAAGESRGMILCPRIMEGLIIKTGTRNFAETGDRRSEARWKAALDELEEGGLVEPLSYKREVFQVTHKGYELTDKLRADSATSGR